MKYIVTTLALGAALVFSGCTPATHSAQSVGQIEQVHYGRVTSVRGVTIGDSGAGTLGGAVVGGLAGSTIGSGRGNTLAIVGGALAGGAVGSQMNQSAGQELTILLQSGEEIVTVVSNKTTAFSFRAGDEVAVRIRNGQITAINVR
jgi:outer membrane lipoprotein SlyB